MRKKGFGYNPSLYIRSLLASRDYVKGSFIHQDNYYKL